MKIRLPFALLIISLLFFTASRIALMAGSFYDVPEETVFYPYIQKLYDEHFITGRTNGGITTGTFDPDSPVTRAEMAKVTVVTRLAEEYGVSHQWQDKEGLAMEEELFDLLTPYLDCLKGACQSIGNRLFTDVGATSARCAEKTGGCDPWFGRYVYFAVSKGFIQGYPLADGRRAFKPGEGILRIHALKMIMVDDFSLPSGKDNRYTRLLKLAESRKSYTPKCLKGAEPWILANNPGAGNRINADSRKLFEYALLADRLDFFGSQCQVFNERGARTPKQRADFLQKPLTRKEVPRYFALSMDYTPAVIPLKEDTTVNDAPENEKSLASFTYNSAAEMTRAEAQAEVIITKAETLVKEGKAKTVTEAVTLIDEKETEKEIAKIPYPDTRPKEEDKKPAVTIIPKKKAEAVKTESAPAALPDSTLPVSLITLKKSIRICGDTGCRTVPPGSELETLLVLNTPQGLMQNVVYGDQLYSVPCSQMKTVECTEAMARVVENQGETAQKKIEGPVLVAGDVCGMFMSCLPVSVPKETNCGPGMNCLPSSVILNSLIKDQSQTNQEEAGSLCNPKITSCLTEKELELIKRTSTDYWYTVIPGWQTEDDGLWGGVFSKKQYNKTYLTDTLFPERSGDKYKELIVKVAGNAESYDTSDPNASANKTAMILNYRTDRWYKIYYTNPSDPDKKVQTGYVPVSALIWKNNIFKVTENGFYIFDYYNTIHNLGYGNASDSRINELLLHNTGGSTAVSHVKGVYSPPHYYLGREHPNDKSAGMDNRFVGYVPEYLASGTANGTGADIEMQSVSVEMVNWEWWNPGLEPDDWQDRTVTDGLFHDFNLEKMKQYEISGKGGDYSHSFDTIQNFTRVIDGRTVGYRDYDLVNYYFSEENGLFEVFNISDLSLPPDGITLKNQVKKDKKVFERFYNDDKNQNGENAYILKAEYTDLVTANSDPDHKLAPLYAVLNRIPFGYIYFNYKQQSTIDFRQVIDSRGTYPFAVYSLNNASRVGKLTDGRIGDYYERYTSQQYANLNTFISHMNEKYVIPMSTFKYDLPDKIPQKYGFYMYDTSIPWEDMKRKTLESPEGIFSHRSIQQGGKMCPAPGFQIDRITVLKKQ